MTVTGKQIVKAVKDSGGFNKKWPPAVSKVMERFLEKDVPKALKGLLGQPATAKLITEAQLEYNRCYLDRDMPRRMIEAVAPAGDPRVNQVVSVLEKDINDAIQALELMSTDFDGLLLMNNMQERDYLLSLNLPPGMTQRILNRSLTVGEFLVEYPVAVMLFRPKPRS